MSGTTHGVFNSHSDIEFFACQSCFSLVFAISSNRFGWVGGVRVGDGQGIVCDSWMYPDPNVPLWGIPIYKP